MNPPIRLQPLSAGTLLVLLLATGCATHPEYLQAPVDITCVTLQEPLSFTAEYVLFNVPWTTRLERGPYWSEKVDELGTFYRAPPGGVSLRGKNGAAFPGKPTTADGGFYVPNDPKEPVRIYRYFSTSDAPVQVPPADASCATLGIARDPATSKISLVTVVDDAVGRINVASMMNGDAGLIVISLPIKDASFMEKLRALAATRVRVKPAPVPPGAGPLQNSDPVPTELTACETN